MNKGASPTPEPSDNEQPAADKLQPKTWSVPLGELYATRNAADQLPAHVMLLAIARHCSGDWGDVCEEDWQLNDEAMEVGNRVLSSYTSPDGVKFWIITEWDRSVTTVLLPDDY
jgi:hypothetical protein